MLILLSLFLEAKNKGDISSLPEKNKLSRNEARTTIGDPLGDRKIIGKKGKKSVLKREKMIIKKGEPLGVKVME